MEDLLASEWIGEINDFIHYNKSDCLALFNVEGILLFANSSMENLLAGNPAENLLNPSLSSLLELARNHRVVQGGGTAINKFFEGYMTFGNYQSRNVSLLGRAYLREQRILIIAALESLDLMDQIDRMHELNAEVNNLDRQLIREKKILERTLGQLEKSNQELSRLSSTKDKLFSILSHDLRNPFNSIMGFGEIILMNLESNDYSELKNHVSEIGKQATITYRLLENLLAWANSQTGAMSFNPESHKVQWFLENAMDEVSSMATRKGISLSLKPLGYNWSILIDENMISTVLRNLLTNAIKFTPKGGLVELFAEPFDPENGGQSKLSEGTMKVQEWGQSKKETQFLLISVIDSGLGISPADLAQLFKVGEHKSRPGTDKEEGTGLGLMLCEEFVKKHDGKIWAESNLGKGSTFKFTVPLVFETQTTI